MTAHRYWRLDISTTSVRNPAVAELILRTSVGGLNVAIGCAASASSTSGTQTPSKAFDGNPATFWSANAPPPQWLKADLGSEYSIVEYAITIYSGSNLYSPTGFTLSYSDDDVAYTVADTQNGIVWSSVGQTQTWEIATPPSGNTADIDSSLGSLATTATATLAMAAAVSCGLGALSCSATMGQAQSATTQPALPALTTDAVASQSQAATAASTLGPLSTAITFTQVNVNTVAIASTLGALGSNASLTQSQAASAHSSITLSAQASFSQSQAASAHSALPPLATAITFAAINLARVAATLELSSAATAGQAQHATGASAFAPLATSAQAAQAQQASADSALDALASTADATQAQTFAANSALPDFWCDASALASNHAQVTATLGALFTAITFLRTPVYIGDGRYYVALPVRPFYASVPSHNFYAAQPARVFYAMNNQSITPILGPKDPRTNRVMTLDATKDLDVDETLTNVLSVDVTMSRGDDPSPKAIINGDPLINQTQIVVQNVSNVLSGQVTVAAKKSVQVPIFGGLTGCWYLIAIICATSNPEKTVPLKAILQVTSD